MNAMSRPFHVFGLAVLFIGASNAQDSGGYSKSTNVNCGEFQRTSQGKPGYTCFGTKRIGSCKGTITWKCKPEWAIVEANEANEDHCRVVDYVIGDTPGRTWLHRRDKAADVGFTNTDGLADPPIRVTDCAIFAYEKSGGEGYRDASEILDPADKPPPKPATRATSEADSLFATALSKSPEELRAEIAVQRARADAAIAATASSAPASSGDSEMFFRLAGAIVGGYVAGKTGDTRLLELATGQEQGSLAGQIAPADAVGSSIGGGGSTNQCTALGQQFQTDLQRASQQSDLCTLLRAQLSIYESYRQRIAQVCANQPGYQATMRDFNAQIPSYQQNLAQRGCGSGSSNSGSYTTPSNVVPKAPRPCTASGPTACRYGR
jgi:hypothetical protein